VITATVTGLSAWIVFATFAAVCVAAVRDYRRICKRDAQRLAKRNTRQPEPWPWPNRLPQQKAPGCSSSTGAQRARS
jgi:hypothetical protein